MLDNFKELFEILGFDCEIKRDYDGNRLELTYGGDDLGLYKFLKIRDAFDVNQDNMINKIGYVYNFAVFDEDRFMVSELTYDEI